MTHTLLYHRFPVLAGFVAGLCVLHAAQAPDPFRPTAVLKGHSEPIYSVAVAPGGQFVATGSFDRTIKLWDLATGKEARSLGGKTGHQNQVLSLVFSPAGDVLASGGSDNVVKLWDVTSKKPTDQPTKTLQHPNLVDAGAFDKTGTLLATGCHDGILRVWDVAKGQATKTINAHTQPQPSAIYTVAWTPDGKQLATGSYDRSIKFWDADSGKLVREIKPGTERLPPDAKLVATAPALVGSFAGARFAAPPEPGHIDQVFTLAFTKDGRYLASGSSDRTVRLWDAKTGKHLRDFPNPSLKPPGPGLLSPSHPGFVHCVRFTPVGSRLVSAGTAPRGQGYLAIWSVADGKLLAGRELSVGPIYSFDLTADGKSVILGCGPKERSRTDSEAVVISLAGLLE